MQAGRAERNVACNTGQIALAQMQLRAQTLQLQHLRVELFPHGPVAADHADAVVQQQPHQRPIAHAQPQDQHGFIL